MKSLLIVTAGLAASAMPAQAQDLAGAPFPGINGAIQRIYDQADVQCRRMGLHLHTTMDTVFGVEDADGRGTVGFVVGPLDCDNAASYGEDPTRREDLDCRGDVCKQYFVLGQGRRARLVWSGYNPQLSGISGLRMMTPGCGQATSGSAEDCPRVYWNGATFTRQRPRRSGPRRRR
jgi:hypothetical protein